MDHGSDLCCSPSIWMVQVLYVLVSRLCLLSSTNIVLIICTLKCVYLQHTYSKLHRLCSIKYCSVMVLMEILRLLLHVWLQVHPRGNAVFLWDWLLHSQARDQQHLIRHLYVCPPFLYSPLHHLLLLRSPTLHCSSGKTTAARCDIINNKHVIPCLSL